MGRSKGFGVGQSRPKNNEGYYSQSIDIEDSINVYISEEEAYEDTGELTIGLASYLGDGYFDDDKWHFTEAEYRDGIAYPTGPIRKVNEVRLTGESPDGKKLVGFKIEGIPGERYGSIDQSSYINAFDTDDDDFVNIDYSPVKSKSRVKAKSPVKSKSRVKAKSPVKSKSRVKTKSPVKSKSRVKAKSPVKSKSRVKAKSPVKSKSRVKAKF